MFLNVFASVEIRDFCREYQLSQTRSNYFVLEINVREFNWFYSMTGYFTVP